MVERPADPRRRQSARWRVLGGIAVVVDGDRLPLRPQSRYILGCLLRTPGRPVPVEQLVRPDGSGSPSGVSAASRVAVSRLRTSLAVRDLDGLLATRPGGYVLDVDPVTVDHVAFDQRVRRAEATEWPDAALRTLDAALAAWGGTPFGEWRTEPAFDIHATSLEERHRQAVDLWGELALRAGQHRRALAPLEAAVREEPLRERRWSALMLAHHRCGNSGDALRAFERAEVLLQSELGIGPGHELQTLAEAIRRRDETLAWRPRLNRTVTRGGGHLSRTSVIIGRDDEITDVDGLLDRHRFVTITGFGGVGKSCVAEKVAGRFPHSAWIVPLADTRSPARLRRAIAENIGLSRQLEEGSLRASIADRLRESRALLVLDNCEHLIDEVQLFAAEIIDAAPEARMLATSRMALDVPGAVSYLLHPLAAGTPDAPGPAALIAADFAMIPTSALEREWDLIAEICRQAGGIPLALELIGAAAAAGDPLTTRSGDIMEVAVAAACGPLPAETRRVIDAMAVLPGGTSAEFLAEVFEEDITALQRTLGHAIRAGLMTRQPGTASTRFALLEPARHVLLDRGPDTTAPILERVTQVVHDLARQSRPSMIHGFDESTVTILDEEHHMVVALVDELDLDRQIELACLLGPIWGICGRTPEAEAWFARLEAATSTVPEVTQARFWVARAQLSPSLAARVPLIDHLRWAVNIAAENGLHDVANRGRAELVVGLLWSGSSPEIPAIIEQIGAAVDPANEWSVSSMAKIRALARAFDGDPAGATRELLQVARDLVGVATLGDVVSNIYLAAVSARLSGDTELLRACVAEADRYRPDRFSHYSHAGIGLERALLAFREADPDAGRLLWDALGQLAEHGEHRTLAVCRRELGRWRLDQGDLGGVVDLARAGGQLLPLDDNAAAVALAVLACHESVGLTAEERDALAQAARALFATPGGGPLTPEERSIVEHVPRPEHDSPSRLDVVALLRSLESRYSSD